MPTSALERAEQDLERGDYGLARQRLTSYLSTTGYDADVLARIGRISYDMHDLFQAGRYWLLSSAEGDVVEQTITTFAKHAGSAPRAVVGQLPRTTRLANLEGYPEPVQERLRRLGLDEAIVRAGRREEANTRMNWRDGVFISGCLIVVAFMIVSFAVGLVQIGSWIFGD